MSKPIILIKPLLTTERGVYRDAVDVTDRVKLTSIVLTQQLENSHVASGTVPLDRISMILFGREFLLGAGNGFFAKDARDGSRLEIISNGIIRYVGFISDADSVDDYGRRCVNLTAVGRVAALYQHAIPPTYISSGQLICPCRARGEQITALERFGAPPASVVNSADLGTLDIEDGIDGFLSSPLTIADPAQLLGRDNLRDALRDLLQVLDAAAVETVNGIRIRRLEDSVIPEGTDPLITIRDADLTKSRALKLRQQIGREATEVRVDYGGETPFVLKAEASEQRRGQFSRSIEAKWIGSRSVAAEIAAFHLERRKFPKYEVTIEIRGVRSVSVLDIVELAIDGTEVGPCCDQGWSYDSGVTYAEPEFPHLYGLGYVSKRTLNLSNDTTTLTVRKSVGIV